MITILDGPLGTELDSLGVNTDDICWSARAIDSDPLTIAQIHRQYAMAGATVHTANTFRTKRRSVGEDWERMARSAVTIARTSVARLSESSNDESESRSTMLNNVPRLSESLNDESETRSTMLNNVPRLSESLNDESETRSTMLNNVPRLSESLNDESETRSTMLNNVPRLSESLPDESETRSTMLNNVPRLSESLPDESETRPTMLYRIAGSIAPLEDCYDPARSPGELSRSEHRELAEVLADAGSDILLCETFAHVGEALVAVEESVRTGVESWLAFTAGPNANLMSPESMAKGAKQAVDAGAAAILVNCTPACDTLRFVQAIADENLNVPIGAYANSGSAAWQSSDTKHVDAYVTEGETLGRCRGDTDRWMLWSHASTYRKNSRRADEMMFTSIQLGLHLICADAGSTVS